jgi:hypothetical protein
MRYQQNEEDRDQPPTLVFNPELPRIDAWQDALAAISVSGLPNKTDGFLSRSGYSIVEHDDELNHGCQSRQPEQVADVRSKAQQLIASAGV